MDKIIECVMNISEGKDQNIIEQIVAPFKNNPHILLMNVEADATYHRSVLSALGEAQTLVKAVLKACELAIELIDMTQHHGIHPRIGAVDVVPFIPIQNATIKDCIQLANQVAKSLAVSKNIPVFLYDQAAVKPEHVHLSSLRKVEFEGLDYALKSKQLIPDYGPSRSHLSGGAVAIGARFPLIAYNIDIKSSDVSIAQAIAKKIRQSSEGFEGIKAKGVYLENSNTTQVTINITDYHTTGISTVFDQVVKLAKEFDTQVSGSEIIGLIPKEALVDTSAEHLMLTHSLENKILDDYVDYYNQQEKEGYPSKIQP
jgi:glutamate formiminotransferase